MSKREFLEELKNFLSILEEREQKDILDEYSQHIEMKIKDGMSEEEAIRDFGDIRELASDIMAAYHVKLPQEEEVKEQEPVQFVVEEREAISPQEMSEISRKDLSDSVRKKAVNLLAEAKEALKRVGKILGNGCTWTGKKVASLFVACGNGILMVLKKPVQLERRIRESRRKQFDKEGNRNAKEGSFMMGVVHLLKKLISDVYLAFLWCVRTCVNLFWAGMAMLFGITALFALFGLGMVTVLLCAGYPLVGVTILCLGGLLVCGSVTVLCFCLIRRDTKGEIQNA